MHELGHVIGFYHEHQRYDRNNYIEMNYENLDSGYGDAASDSYKKIEEIYMNDFGVGYDYASVMHYGKEAFAKHNLDAFTVKKDLPECLIDVGQRISISSKDIEQANKLYNCPKMPIPSLCELLSPIKKQNIKIGKIFTLMHWNCDLCKV